MERHAVPRGTTFPKLGYQLNTPPGQAPLSITTLHPATRQRYSGMRVTVFTTVATLVSGHGAVVFPRSRNSMDGNLAPWTKWGYPCDATHQGADCAIHFSESGTNAQGGCAITAKNGVKGALNASNGQVLGMSKHKCRQFLDLNLVVRPFS